MATYVAKLPVGQLKIDTGPRDKHALVYLDEFNKKLKATDNCLNIGFCIRCKAIALLPQKVVLG